MRTTNSRIWSHADEADKLADLLQRRVSHRDMGPSDCDITYDRLAKIRAELAAIKRLANDKAGGA